MGGRGQALASIVAAAALLAFLVLPGSAGARGGNHGCNSAEGNVYSSHFFLGGDNIVAGYFQEPGTLGDPTETVTVQNTGTEGGGPSGVNCQSDVGATTSFTSELGPDDDSVRLDAQGLDGKYPAPPLELPASIDTDISGDGGADTIRGHDGLDEIRGGSGDDLLVLFRGKDVALGGAGEDLIKAARGGRDTVGCGPDSDKAIVDERDQVSGCERVIRR